ncbi:hypothetical protein M899_0576 [Bacteriovorax sp. BSW11_IV]|uniref:hypothetical protein n=1 Tax=Bacteriovorax sp. BSW11_IV TaxID=1353529 RepID=UPI00038A48B5|nr:hypothetical protein [Bacteriovorax sp. BSW11_IV]EQC45004.1 hypothetical protein M899_0576 [Bacteriovorax sp. BSW11_IV]
MRIGVEIYLCDKCKSEHRVDFPVAENAREYNSSLTQLPRRFSQFESGECRRMVVLA